MTSKLKNQIEQSPSATLIKKQLQAEAEKAKLGNNTYKSLYGESNPNRKAADAYSY